MLGGLFSCGLAHAQAPPPPPTFGEVSLDYRLGPGTTGCPGEAAFRERAADVFDFRDPFVAKGKAAAARMRIEIVRAATGYQGTVFVLDPGGRPLAGAVELHDNCDALVWMLGHRMGLAIVRRPAAPPPPSPPAPPRPAPPLQPLQVAHSPVCAPPPATALESAPALESPAFSMKVTAGAIATAGWTAGVGPGAWLGFEAHRQWFSLGLETRALFPAKTLTFSGGRSSEATTLSALLVPCAHWKLLFGCAFVEAGTYVFTVPGRPTEFAALLFSLGPRAGVDVPIRAGLSVRAVADFGFHPHAPVFRVRLTNAADSPVGVWTTPLFSGYFGAGIAWSP